MRVVLLLLLYLGILNVALEAQSSPDGVKASIIERNLIRKYGLAGLSQRKISRGFNLYSHADELQMGMDAAAEIEEAGRTMSDPEINSYINKLGMSLVVNSDARDRQFSFRVLRDDEINAMSLPNGVIYINAGLILATENEAELASVVAHEIAHVAARHATRNATKRGIMGAMNLSLAMFGGGIAAAIQPVAGFAEQSFLAQFSRDSEREADLLGMEYQYLAGYDPEAFIAFLGRIEHATTKDGKWARLRATHPATGERIAQASKAIAVLLPPKAQYIEDTSDFAAFRAKVIDLTHPERKENEEPVLLVKRPQEVQETQ